MAYKCQKITFTIFTILFAIIVIFVAAIFQIILQGKVNGEALMAEENNDLWASFPGRSLIKVYRDNFFYNITDPDNFFQNIKKNQIPVVQELGPYRYQEFTDWINREYSEDLNEVSFHLYKRFKQISEYEIQKQQDKVTTLNLPALGVWQTAKSIPRPNVCLTALYTLWKGLLTDFYFQAAWTGLNTTLNKEDSSLFKSVFIDRLDLPTVTIEKMFSDKKYGLQAENGFFAKALLEYNYIDVDNKDFLFFQKYFDLSFFEMNYFLEKANEIIDKLMGVLIGETDRNKFPRTAAIKQFSSLQVNFGQSIFGKNSTIPGYVEYGAFLKYKAGDYKTKLTYEDFERILAFNDFGYKGVKVDMKNSLLLKKNLDVIMDPLKNKKQSVEDLKKITLINDDEEANHLFDYLNYISGEMALQISKGGKSEQVAFATFVSQAMFQVTDGMGMLLFDNILAKRTYDNEIFNKDCIQILTANLYPGTDVSIYCSDEVNSPMNFETFRDFWYVGIMYKKEELMKFLNYDKIKFNYITNVNANFHLLFKKYVNIISKEYNFDAGHFETKNLLPLVVKQMLTGEITKKEFYGLKSVKDLPQAKGVFVKEPEYYIYCKEQGVKPNLTEEQLLNNLSYDGLFSQFFIQNVLIEYNKKPSEKHNLNEDYKLFSNDLFVNYMRRLMMNEVMGGMIVTKSISQMIWGYEDKLLNIVKSQNYYQGGDPSLSTLFSLGKNLTEVPKKEDKNKWKAFTGKLDMNQVRQFTSTSGEPERKVVIYEPYWNGEEVVMSYRNPWKTDLFLNGTDAFAFNTNQNTSSKPWIYADDFYMTGHANYRKTYNYKGFNIYRFQIDKSLYTKGAIYPFNYNFYMDKYDGFGNQTSVQKAPIFLSKPYYKDCELPNHQIKIIPYQNVINPESDNPDDIEMYLESFIDIEPYSGACLGANQKILVSILLQPDVLFDLPGDIFVPVNYVIRGGNVTQAGVTAVVGDLKTGLKIQLIGIIASSILLAIFSSLLIYYCMKKEEVVHSDLKDSMINRVS